MTDLAKHIEILLLDNDCVIVPDFGGFMAHYACSEYSDDEALFLPPKRTLGFNPQLTINDSLLAQSYVEAYDISYPEALRRIEDDVNELRQHIATEGLCELPDVGILSLDENGSYDFSPCPSGILSPSLYALNSFEMQPLVAKKTNIIPIDVVAEQSLENNDNQNSVDVIGQTNPEVEQTSSLNTNDEANVEDESHINGALEQNDDEQEKVISISISTLKRVALAAVLLVCFILVSVPIGDGIRDNVRLCSIDSSLLSRIMPSTKVEGSLPEFLNQKTNAVVSKTSEIVRTDEKVASEETTKDTYVIVLAACVSKTNADTYVNQLKQNGVDDARVLEKGKRKVICGSYPDETAAREGLRKLQSKTECGDAWVLKVQEK